MTRNRLRKKVLMLQIKLKEIRSQKIRPSKNLDKLFLRMVELYSKKVCEISKGAQADDLDDGSNK